MEFRLSVLKSAVAHVKDAQAGSKCTKEVKKNRIINTMTTSKHFMSSDLFLILVCCKRGKHKVTDVRTLIKEGTGRFIFPFTLRL